MERFYGSEAFLIRDGLTTAAFHLNSMAVSALAGDAPSLEELHRSIETGPGRAADLGPVLERRGAIHPLLFGDAQAAGRARPELGRLTINISNACNLVCDYCYADHGLYHSPRSFVSPERAGYLVDRIAGMYAAVATVHFFGGEPLMNVAAIDAVGEGFEAAVADGRLPHMPNFVATTNGTLSGDRVMRALERWKIALTVSWDGPDHVHDRARPTASGKPSSGLLRRSLDRFAAHGVPFSFECTFNKAHLDAGVGVVALMDFFAQASDERSFHIAPAFVPDEQKRESDLASAVFDNHGDWRSLSVQADEVVPQFREAAAVAVRNFFAGHGPLLGFAARIIEQLIERQPSKTYCPAFFNQLSIAADGSVFPCFMFIGDPQFRMGDLFTDEFPNAESRRVFRRYFDEFGEGGLGTSEWYAPLSGGCIAGDAIATGSFGKRAMAPLFEAMTEECVLGLARHALGETRFGILEEREQGHG